MKVVIIGGAGFIGSHLADYLAGRGDEVVVFDPCNAPVHTQGLPSWPNSRATYALADPRQSARAWAQHGANADSIVHLAALTGTGQSLYEVTAYTSVNAGLSAWLAEELIKARVRPRALVFASTRAIYGEGPGVCQDHGRVSVAPRTRADLEAGRWEPRCSGCRRPARSVAVQEVDALEPRSPYAMSKRYAEELLTLAGEVSHTPVMSLRLFNVYGPRQVASNPYVGVVSAFARAGLAGDEIELYEDGGIVRDFVFVSDAVNALVAAVDNPTTDKLNIGSGQATSLLQLAEAVTQVTGTAKVRVTGRSRIGDPRCVVADTSRAVEVLGWRPCVGLAEGIGQTIEWLRTEETVASPLGRATAELKSHRLLVTR